MKINESQFALIMAAFILFLILVPFNPMGIEPQAAEESPKWSAVELLMGQHREKLTDWQMLIMAIAWTESKFNPAADSGMGDSGLLQLRKIYCDEVNRLYGTAYTIEDAFDIDKSLEMFSLMQEHYNPGKDIEEAIKHHNKSASYKRVVLENLELIKRYETFRAKLIEK